MSSSATQNQNTEPHGPWPDAFECITWIAHSKRHGQPIPDSYYGWATLPEANGANKTVFAKWIDSELLPQAEAMIKRELNILLHFQRNGLPAPKLLAIAPTGLISDFVGLSLSALRKLRASHALPMLLSPVEELAVLYNAIRRAHELEQRGILPIDLRESNLAIATEKGLEGGRLRLYETIFIDHTATIQPGDPACALAHPLWIGTSNYNIAPEVKVLLEEDLDNFKRTARAQRAKIYLDECQTQQDKQHLNAFYAGYVQPQALQKAIDDGTLLVGAAMQYAFGQELKKLCDSHEALPGLDALRRIQDCLLEKSPDKRYLTLNNVCEALLEWAGLYLGRRGFPLLSKVALPAITVDMLGLHLLPVPIPARRQDADASILGQGSATAGQPGDGTTLPDEPHDTLFTFLESDNEEALKPGAAAAGTVSAGASYESGGQTISQPAAYRTAKTLSVRRFWAFGGALILLSASAGYWLG